MHRRALLRLVPAGAAVGFAGALAGREVAGAEDGREPPRTPRGLPPLKITDIKTILTAPDRIRLVVVKVLDQRAGPLRPRLRHVHPAGARGADGRRQVPQAVPRRPRRRPDRGHLAVVLRQLVLAERPGAVQRHERRRHGPLGHQGQAGGHARLPAPGRQVPVRRRALRPRQRARRPARSRTGSAPRWRRATGTSASRSAIPGLATYGARRRPRARRDRTPSAPTDPEAGLGARPVRADGPQAVRAPAGDGRRRRRAAPRRPRADLARARRSSSARTWRSTACSSSKTRCRPRRRTTSA